MKSLNKNFSISLIITLAILISQCETKERFYRPNVPQELCTISILDIDDSTIYDILYPFPSHKDTVTYSRYISFEKSFQFEYLEERNDSLRDFSFRISNENEDMYVYHNKHTIKNLEIIIPDNLKFESGRKYFLHASEKETSDISAEIEVPPLPKELSLISFKTEIITLEKPYLHSCAQNDLARNIEIEFSFLNDNPKSFYAILLTASWSDSRLPSFLQWGSNLLQYTVLETNTTGFIYPLQGRKTFQSFCRGVDLVEFYQSPVSAYFIDGSKIPDKNCTLKIATQTENGISVPGFSKCYRIRLISIPEELYLFEKSLFNYNRVSDDPFAEPVNLKGNIKGGNGVFAICRSRELIVYSNPVDN
jgi:hypothetical protein